MWHVVSARTHSGHVYYLSKGFPDRQDAIKHAIEYSESQGKPAVLLNLQNYGECQIDDATVSVVEC